MTEIIPSAHRWSWAAPVQHGTQWDKSKPMMKWRSMVLERDNHTCQGCGWRALKFQEIHHRDHDHNNFRESNLETLCPLCHQLFHPATASISGGGQMIWMPEMSQVHLNRLLFPLFAIMRSGPTHPAYAVSKAVWGLLEMRKVFLENQIGRSDPGVFGQMMLNMTPSDYQQRSQSMGAIKMLANPSRFETEIDYWKALLDEQKTPEQWMQWANTVVSPDVFRPAA